jgi:hypothetical protein
MHDVPGHSYSKNERWFAMIKGSGDSALGELGYQRSRGDLGLARVFSGSSLRSPRSARPLPMWRFVSLIGLTFLFFSQASATEKIGLSIGAVVRPVHYSRLYGWHCGMRTHRHKKTCGWSRGGYWGDSEEYQAWRRRSFGAGGRPVEN